MFKKSIIVAASFVSLAVIHLFIYTQIIDLSYQNEKLTRNLSKLRSENRNLNSIVSAAESPQRIEKIAREKLNMIYPDKINFLKK